MDTVLNLLAATLRLSTPLVLVALGGIMSEKSGVVNIGLEGMMLTGSFFSIATVLLTGSIPLGIIAGIVSGGLVGLLHGFLSIHLKADQTISGVGINIFALALTSYLIFQIFGVNGQTDGISSMPYPVEVFGKIPLIGIVLKQLNWFVYVAIILVFVLWFVLYKTPLGLRIRAVGEYPKAADTLGVSVYKIRYLCVVLSGMLAGLGGTALAMNINLFRNNMSAGKGFIAIAALIFGNWNPIGAFGACVLFGFAEALQLNAQTLGIPIPVEVFSMFPYILTMIALTGFVGKTTAPKSLGALYEKGTR